MRVLCLFLISCLILLTVSQKIPSKEECPSDATAFVNSPAATQMWSSIKDGNLNSIQDAIKNTPCLVHVRSEDGRGPLFWAYEFNKPDIINFLITNGCEENERDVSGKLPKDLQPSIGLNFKPGRDINGLPKHLRDDSKPKQPSEEEEMQRLAKERMEKMKKQLNEENDEL
eukprot:gene8374-199_t